MLLPHSYILITNRLSPCTFVGWPFTLTFNLTGLPPKAGLSGLRLFLSVSIERIVRRHPLRRWERLTDLCRYSGARLSFSQDLSGNTVPDSRGIPEGTSWVYSVHLYTVDWGVREVVRKHHRQTSTVQLNLCLESLRNLRSGSRWVSCNYLSPLRGLSKYSLSLLPEVSFINFFFFSGWSVCTRRLRRWRPVGGSQRNSWVLCQIYFRVRRGSCQISRVWGMLLLTPIFISWNNKNVCVSLFVSRIIEGCTGVDTEEPG